MKHAAPASPQYPHTNRAAASFLAGNYQDSLRNASKAVEAEPLACDAYYWLARSHYVLRGYQSALDALRTGLRRWPDDEGLLTMQGMTLMKLGDPDGACNSLKHCVAVHKQSLSAWTTYSVFLQEQFRWEEARLASLMALSIAPDDQPALVNYAKALKETGRPELAISAARRAVELAPDDASARSQLVFLLLLCDGATALELREETVQLARLMASKRKPTRPVQPRGPGRRVRLGIMSNDINRHACSYFLIPLLANLDRTRVEVVVVSLNAHQDGVTKVIAGLADRFVDVAGKSEVEIVEAVRAEGLDALIDLGGFTGVSPLTYMVYGLAPVQLSWLGFPGGTGMPEIGYRISDRIGDPQGYDAHYTETLLRAPGAFGTYFPLVHDPLRVYQPEYQVAPTPALRNGYITFGSCNNIGKLTTRVLQLWQAVLARCPGSKLLVEAAGLGRESVRAELLQRMAEAGIAEDRLILVPMDRRNQYLTYHDIDIVLDTTPMTGGTTTCDALWMGVPIVSLQGKAFHSRMSTSYLHAVGLDWLACENDAAYVEAAAQLAADVEQLNALRLSIRPRFERSAISDAAGFAGWLEDQLIDLVGQHRHLNPMPPGLRNGLEWNGTWHTEAELAVTIAGLLGQGDEVGLKSLLERMCAKWSMHWMTAFALAELEHRKGKRERAIELLILSIGQRDGYLPLYRQLAAWLGEAGLDGAWLQELVQERFGEDVGFATLPVPGVTGILGLLDTKEQA